MKDSTTEHERPRGRHGHGHGHAHEQEPTLQIICLASGGGPAEDNVTGFLVRSASTKWAKNSVLAVDAGSHLASITRILEKDFPLFTGGHRSHSNDHSSLRRNGSIATTDDGSILGDDDSNESSASEPTTTTLESGPFAGLPFPHESARANAVHIVRECVSTYLITHAHLDHLSGFVINTAAFHNTSRPKRLAALPSTVNAIKTHIFNDIIWPNLTDEDGGVGLVTFQRLAQGGNVAVGEGYGKGYIEVCDGLCVKGMKLSHGHCTRGSQLGLHRDSDVGLSEATVLKTTQTAHPMESPQLAATRRTPSISQISQPGTPGLHSTLTTSGQQPAPAGDPSSREVVVDSTAYFIRDDSSGREALIFGDVEPDSLSLNPRNAHVWAEAAPKIAAAHLRAIFIECSYDDSQPDSNLFGHLCPRHLVRELQVLAQMVRARRMEERDRKDSRKRKRDRGGAATWPLSSSAVDPFSTDVSGPPTEDEAVSHTAGSIAKRRGHRGPWPPRLAGVGRDGRGDDTSVLPSPFEPTSSSPFGAAASRTGGGVVADRDFAIGQAAAGALVGLRVVVIHMKDTLRDGPFVGELILKQLREHEARLREVDGVGLGCEFACSVVGDSYWL